MSTQTGKCSECGEVKRCIKCSDGLLCESCIGGTECPENTVPTCERCGALGYHTNEPHPCTSHKTPWYEDLKPFTLVVDSNNFLYVASHYKHGFVYDFKEDIIGKPAHLRIATAAEHSFLNYEGKD